MTQATRTGPQNLSRPQAGEGAEGPERIQPWKEGRRGMDMLISEDSPCQYCLRSGSFEGPSLWKETDPGWRPCSGQGGASVAATGLDHHVAVFAQDDVVAAVIVEHRGGAQLGGRTARLGNRVRLHQVHLAGEGRQAEA